jgi:hypothetical protein
MTQCQRDFQQTHGYVLNQLKKHCGDLPPELQTSILARACAVHSANMFLEIALAENGEKSYEPGCFIYHARTQTMSPEERANPDLMVLPPPEEVPLEVFHSMSRHFALGPKGVAYIRLADLAQSHLGNLVKLTRPMDVEDVILKTREFLLGKGIPLLIITPRAGHGSAPAAVRAFPTKGEQPAR